MAGRVRRDGGGRDGGWFPPSRPIEVDGGLRARSVRGRIGQTWWSRRFLDVLESFALGSRLTRGRNYARRGQVLELSIAAGVVSARVQGSRTTPYRVDIEMPPLPDEAWRRVERLLAGRAGYSAALLAGRMPADVEDAFSAAGAALFPTALHEMRLSCSCPDPQVPCKHLAATFYLLAEEFDTDPFQILSWRGRQRRDLLDRLRALRTGTEPGRPETGVAHAAVAGGEVIAGGPRAAPAVGAARVFAAMDQPPPEVAADRFFLPGAPLPRPPVMVAADAGLLLRQLPVPGGSLGGAKLIDALRPAYERFARHAAGDDAVAGAGDEVAGDDAVAGAGDEVAGGGAGPPGDRSAG